jgi:hypothetical protein
VADLVTKVRTEAGVRRIYGVPGDSLNGITDSIRERKDLQWIHVRHEETAAFAAGAEAHLTGSLAVCAGRCGPLDLAHHRQPGCVRNRGTMPITRKNAAPRKILAVSNGNPSFIMLWKACPSCGHNAERRGYRHHLQPRAGNR